MVGAARPTVNKHLVRWKQQSIVTIERGRITLHRPDELRRWGA